MQGEPVPTALVGREGLAAPLTVEPGRPTDLKGLAVDFQGAAGLEKRLTVVVRGLTLFGLLAEPLVPLQHQRTCRDQPQPVAETLVTGAEQQVGQGIVGCRLAAQLPVVDPCIERRNADTGLTDAATGIALRRVMHRRRRHRRMTEPDRLVLPACHLGGGFQGTAEQRPLRAELMPLSVLQVGGDVPPFDAKAIVGAVIRREAEHPTGHHLGKRSGLVAQPGKTFFYRCRLIAAIEQQRQQHQEQDAEINFHRQTCAASPPVACGTNATTARLKPAMSPPAPGPSTATVATGTPATAGASQRPAH
ncbi:hypothetical protein D3C78_1196460 [compost metagenome]